MATDAATSDVAERALVEPERDRPAPVAPAPATPAEVAAPPTPAADQGGWGVPLAVLIVGMFMSILDISIINVAIPTMQRDFAATTEEIQWVENAYSLALGVVVPVSAWLAARFGPGRVYNVSLMGFAAGSALCGLAWNLDSIVAFRVLQAIPGGVLPVVTLTILYRIVPPAKIGAAMGMYGLGIVVAPAVGPTLGGYLVEYVDWRLIFFINVPVGATALLLLARTQQSALRPAPFDWAGQLSAVLAMGGLTYGAIEAGAAGFTATRVLTAFAVAVVALGVFLAVEARGAHPMVPLDLFRSRTVAVAVVVGFAFVVGYYGLPFVMSLYMQQLRGLSPLATGAAFLPMMVIGAVLTPFSARLAEKLGARVLIATGLTLMTAGLVALGVVPAATPVWVLAVLMVFAGLAGPLVMPPVTAVLLNGVPAHRAGTASGLFNTSRQIGGALAVAVFGALLADQGAFLHGLRISLLIAAAVVLAAAAASLRLLPC
jgi:MFS transporter, DHA2 family, methylenomycin A resistance protein